MDLRRRSKIGTALALLLVGGVAGALAKSALALVTPTAPRSQKQLAPEGFAEMNQVLRRKAETNQPWLRSWWSYRDPNLGIAYSVVPKRVPMHVHLDADHVLIVVEGWASVTVGGAKAALGVGDSIHVPRGMAHDVTRGGVNRLVVMDVTAPAGDMRKTFWIENPATGAPGAAGATSSLTGFRLSPGTTEPAPQPSAQPAGRPAASAPAANGPAHPTGAPTAATGRPAAPAPAPAAKVPARPAGAPAAQAPAQAPTPATTERPGGAATPAPPATGPAASP